MFSWPIFVIGSRIGAYGRSLIWHRSEAQAERLQQRCPRVTPNGCVRPALRSPLAAFKAALWFGHLNIFPRAFTSIAFFLFSMKLSITTVCLIAGSALYAQGSQDVANNSSNNQHRQSAGAAYCKQLLELFMSVYFLALPCLIVMTNQPEGNFLISCDVGSDGRLTFRNALSTGGKGINPDQHVFVTFLILLYTGAHGITPDTPFGPDALFSSSSVKISGHQVYTVNVGFPAVERHSQDSLMT